MKMVRERWHEIRSQIGRFVRACAAALVSSWEALWQWCNRHSIGLITLGLVAALLILFLWPLIIVSIHSGEAGILYSRLFGGTVEGKIYGEGLHIIWPWDLMYVYNTRLQEDTMDVRVLSRGGLSVNMKVSVFYFPIYDRLPALHKEVGPQFREKLVLPIVAASVRNTVGNYWPEDLYTSTPLKLQDEIMVQVVQQMARKPLVVDNLVVRHIELPQSVNTAIDQKFAAEQDYLRYKFVLLKSREELKRRYIEAESVRLFQETVNQGLTDNFLRWSGIEATKELAASPNAKFVIMGNRDGLPLILNTDTGKPSVAAPAAPARSDTPGRGNPAGAGSGVSGQAAAQGVVRRDGLINWDVFTEKLKALESSLQTLDKSMNAAPTPAPAQKTQ